MQGLISALTALMVSAKNLIDLHILHFPGSEGDRADPPGGHSVTIGNPVPTALEAAQEVAATKKASSKRSRAKKVEKVPESVKAEAQKDITYADLKSRVIELADKGHRDKILKFFKDTWGSERFTEDLAKKYENLQALDAFLTDIKTAPEDKTEGGLF